MKAIDLKPIVTVQANGFPFGNSSLKEFPWKAKYDSLTREYNREMLSIQFEGEDVGAMFIEHHEIPELVFFEISGIWRGRGIGRAALDMLFDILRRRNVEKLLVQTGRPEIYQGMGYQIEEVDSGHILIDLNMPRPDPVFFEGAVSCCVYSSRYHDHDYPIHPEHDGRVAHTMTRLEKEKLLADMNMLEPKPASEEEILQVHTKELLERVKHCSETGEPVTRDTPTGPESYYAARLSFGGALMAAELLERYKQVFVLCRPPGHHASRDRCGGFCFFNNMAGLALKLYKQGLRPMVVDWDVHHGNGTQEILYELPIMYVSFHQRYLYPHSGSEEETGNGKGEGYTRNFPQPIGAVDDQFLEDFRKIKTIAEEYQPDVLLISAGQDGHYRDKLSGMRLTSDCFLEMGRIAGDVAEKTCEGRVVLLLEGGYDLDANAEALAMAIKGIRSSAG
jgi:acetoin utilization deacetylase AcuC-like enzyme